MESKSDNRETNDDLSEKPVLCDLSDFKPRKSADATFPDETSTHTRAANEETEQDSSAENYEVRPSKHLCTDVSDESPSSSGCLSTGFECTTLFNLDHVDDSAVTSNIYSEDGSERSSAQSEFHFPCESSTSLWKSLTTEGSFCHDVGLMSYPGDLDYLTTSGLGSMSRTSDSQLVGRDDRRSPLGQQQSAPLRIPEIHPPDQSSQWVGLESETSTHQDSLLNFLSSFFPSTDFSREPTTNHIDFDTEFSFSNRDFVPPTESISKPLQERLSGASNEPRHRTSEARRCDFPQFSGSPDAVERSVSSVVMDVPEPWQQFAVNETSSQNKFSNHRNVAAHHRRDLEFYGTSQRNQAVPVCSSMVTSSVVEHYSEESHCVEASSTTKNNTSSPYLSHLSPVSDLCEVTSGTSDSSDSDSSVIDPTTTPPNPVAVQSVYHASDHFQSSTFRDIPPLPPLSFGSTNERFPCSSNVPALSQFASFPQPMPYNDSLPAPANILRPLPPTIQPVYSSTNCSVIHPGNIILSRPAQTWETIQRGQYQHMMYPTYPYLNKYYDVPQNTHSLEPLCLDKSQPLPLDEAAEREPITLVPIPDDSVGCTLPYSCPLEYYAWNSGRFSAIQPLTVDAAHFQRCCEQNIRISSRKRGAVSIKTKEGKFLCMASDFHTKTVRELLESAETCKASSKTDSNEVSEGTDECKQSENESSTRSQPESSEEPLVPQTMMTDGLQPNAVTHEPSTGRQDLCMSSSDVHARQTPSDPTPVDFSSIPNLACGQKCQEGNSSTERSVLQRPFPLSGSHPGCPEILQEKSGSCSSPTTSYPLACTPPLQSLVSRSLTGESQTFSTSISMQPRGLSTQCTRQLNPLNGQHGEAETNSSTPQTSTPTRDFLYRGAVVLNGSCAPQCPNPPHRFQPPADKFQHFMLHSGEVGDCYRPIFPPREVQLRTAQPYPLFHPTSHAQPFQLPRHPCLVPHAGSSVSGYSGGNMTGTAEKTAHPGQRQATSSSGSAGTSKAVQRWFIPVAQDKSAPNNTSYSSGLVSSSMVTTTAPCLPRPSYAFSPKLQDERKRLKKSFFRPKHFEFSCLEIGNYKYTCGQGDIKTAKVKVIFSKKKFAYEFQLNEMEDVHQTHRKQLALIEVPFGNIIGLCVHGNDMKIEVGAPPKVYRGEQILKKDSKFGMHLNARYNRTEEKDMTDGEVHHVPYHYIHLRSNCVGKLKHQLQLFDVKFELLLQLPFVEQPGKTLVKEVADLVPLTPVLQKAKKDDSNDLTCQSPSILLRRHYSNHGCHCVTGCKSTRCSCMKQMQACGDTCQCRRCENCLNLLQKAGVNVEEAKTDSCLLQNLLKITNLENFLETEVLFSCCEKRVMVRRCIPGEVACPMYPHCLARYRFSWCLGILCDQVKSPRSHCKICQSCFDQQYRHCGSCNRCYLAGSSGFSCPSCNASSRRNRETKDVATLSEAEMIRNILPIG